MCGWVVVVWYSGWSLLDSLTREVLRDELVEAKFAKKRSSVTQPRKGEIAQFDRPAAASSCAIAHGPPGWPKLLASHDYPAVECTSHSTPGVSLFSLAWRSID